jgi:hypothetical protein
MDDDDAHRPRRVGLRHRKARDGRESGSTRSQMQKLSAGKFHGVPLKCRRHGWAPGRCADCETQSYTICQCARKGAPCLFLALGVFHCGAQNFDAIGGTADIDWPPAPIASEAYDPNATFALCPRDAPLQLAECLL